MGKVEITINGVAYPCGDLVMGALRRFERETGKNAMLLLRPDHLPDISFSDLGELMWACASCATEQQGREFPFTVNGFLDACPPGVAYAWFKQVMQEETPDEGQPEGGEVTDEKKSLTA